MCGRRIRSRRSPPLASPLRTVCRHSEFHTTSNNCLHCSATNGDGAVGGSVADDLPRCRFHRPLLRVSSRGAQRSGTPNPPCGQRATPHRLAHPSQCAIRRRGVTRLVPDLCSMPAVGAPLPAPALTPSLGGVQALSATSVWHLRCGAHLNPIAWMRLRGLWLTRHDGGVNLLYLTPRRCP